MVRDRIVFSQCQAVFLFLLKQRQCQGQVVSKTIDRTVGPRAASVSCGAFPFLRFHDTGGWGGYARGPKVSAVGSNEKDCSLVVK